jgi:hypothetical protein
MIGGSNGDSSSANLNSIKAQFHHFDHSKQTQIGNA